MHSIRQSNDGTWELIYDGYVMLRGMSFSQAQRELRKYQ
jgi:hypothetical protein